MRRAGVAGAFILALVMVGLFVPSGQASAPNRHGIGTRIYWTQVYDAGPDGVTARLVVSDGHGRGVRPLTRPPKNVEDIDPRVSPNGQYVLFERDYPDGSTKIVVIGADGHGERPLPLGCVDPCAADLEPTWTPDGRHVVFTRIVGPFDQPNDSATSAVLWRTDLQGHYLKRLSQRGIDGAFEDYRATFAPAGYVVFVRVRNSDVHSAAFRMDSDGSHVLRLTPWALDADTLSVSPARSGPSRDLVVFETYGHQPPEGATSAVATVSARERSNPDSLQGIRFLTSTHSQPVQHFNPAWSPNGRSVAYVTLDQSGGDIWRMKWNGASKQRVSFSPLFEFRPAWGVAPGGY